MNYFQKPEDFAEKFTIVSCFVEWQGYFLLLQRVDRVAQPAMRGPPAGKVKSGELPEQAIVRELQEETKIEVTEQQLQFWGESYVRYPEYDFVYREYIYSVAEKPAIVLNPTEHQKYRRVRPEQALAMDLMPGEELLVRRRYGIAV